MSPRRAATVLLLRPAAGAQDERVEVLLVRRASRATFMANAHVFPGGAVDDVDRAAAQRDGEDPEDLGACRECARRELAEEAAVTLARAVPLVRFARWITPSAEGRRFDADFFLAALPPDQTPAVDEREVFDARFLTPGAALVAAQSNLLLLPPPTYTTLWELRALARTAHGDDPVAALLRAAAGRAVPSITPKLVPGPEPATAQVVLPWDAEFAALPGDGQAVAAPVVAEGTGSFEDRPPRRFLISSAGFQPVF